MIYNNIGYIICESAGEINATIEKDRFNGKVIAKCRLQTANEKNRNGRIYPREELFAQLESQRIQELLSTGTLKAECGHPLSKDLQRQSTIDDTRTCARFLKIWTEGDDIIAHAIGTNNDLGKAFDLDLKEGVLPAWSLRALGSVTQTPRGAEVKNLRIITWDNVIYPSHMNAYTLGLVTESANTNNKTNLQKAITESAIGSEYISETNDINDSSIIVPIVNEDVINYIKSESSNLKFIKECFDFVYDSVTINENGSKVLLTTVDGDTLVINLENYIHRELLNYKSKDNNKKDFDDISFFNI